MAVGQGILVLAVLFFIMVLFAVSVFITFRKSRRLADEDTTEE